MSTLTLIEAPPVVKIEHLSKRFGPVTALKNINLEVPTGRIVGLLGPNGSGKTTLIKILAGFYTSYEGKVSIHGQSPSHLTKAVTSYQPDKSSFPPHMTVNEAVSIHKSFFMDFDEVQCKEMLNTFQINEWHKISQMSKGIIDKLQICLTMSRRARLYLLDEPIGGVDTVARDFVLNTILGSFNPAGTIIVATHLISQIEQIFDTAIVLSKGSLVCFDDCDAIRQRYGLSLEDSLLHIYGGK
ncbi:MAG: ABC transporter ATP-binding protein [Eubacteriales bacterium]|nr:ABC transporter ATP-binding protein [Eubacteriales bacterium]